MDARIFGLKLLACCRRPLASRKMASAVRSLGNTCIMLRRIELRENNFTRKLRPIVCSRIQHAVCRDQLVLLVLPAPRYRDGINTPYGTIWQAGAKFPSVDSV